jgi:hypothetical protein
MKTVHERSGSAYGEAQSFIADTGRTMASLSWQLIRLPVYILLVILEPVVDVVFGGVALLGVLVSLFFRLSSGISHFPFWTMILISIGFGLVPRIYGGIIRLFSS